MQIQCKHDHETARLHMWTCSQSRATAMQQCDAMCDCIAMLGAPTRTPEPRQAQTHRTNETKRPNAQSGLLVIQRAAKAVPGSWRPTKGSKTRTLLQTKRPHSTRPKTILCEWCADQTLRFQDLACLAKGAEGGPHPS